ncbi:MAG: hypothetical protein ACR2HJ_03570 [Fimbriimonadales bacterium]
MKRLRSVTERPGRAWRGASIAVVVGVAAHAGAQWTFIDLTPQGSQANALGADAGSEVGWAASGSQARAVRWSGSSESGNFLPDGLHSSVATAVQGREIVGYGRYNVQEESRAILWSDRSWIDLTPKGALAAQASDVHNGQQVGGVDLRHEYPSASLWRGTAESWVDLSPAGSGWSWARGVHNGRQAGWAVFGSSHAGYWRGTAASWVDLHPVGALNSMAFAIDADQEVGELTSASGGAAGACLWRGSADTYVDLDPGQGSKAYGVHEGQQVGEALVRGKIRATLWYGSRDTYVDLHPAHAERSEAYAVYDTGDVTRVVGKIRIVRGWNSTVHAGLWIRQNSIIPPVSFDMLRGSVVSGNLSSLLSSDDNRLVMRPGAVFSNAEPPIQIRLNGISPQASPPMLSFQMESSASIGNAEMNIALYNFATQTYDVIETHMATMIDSVERVNVTGNASDYIEAGTRNVRARISYKALGPVFIFPWFARIDRARWIVPGT